LQTRVIIFDQVDHVSHLTAKWQLIVMDWIKWVSSSTGANVIAAGTEYAEELVKLGPQFESRFMVMQLPLWTAGQPFGTFLGAYERSLPLRRPSGLSDLRMQRKILNETRAMHIAFGATDGVVRILKDAAIAAIRTGAEKISVDLLSAWKDTPMLAGESGERVAD
jgi:Bacterial TniB protein